MLKNKFFCFDEKWYFVKVLKFKFLLILLGDKNATSLCSLFEKYFYFTKIFLTYCEKKLFH